MKIKKFVLNGNDCFRFQEIGMKLPHSPHINSNTSQYYLQVK